MLNYVRKWGPKVRVLSGKLEPRMDNHPQCVLWFLGGWCCRNLAMICNVKVYRSHTAHGRRQM